MTGGCEECGFDPREWNDQDTANTLRLADSLTELWAEPLVAVDPELANSLSGAGPWSRSDAVDGGSPSGDEVHGLWHHLIHIASVVSASGAAAPAQEGTVDQISASGGGVPKVATPVAEIDRRGVIGDQQRTRKHHGRPWQALCLWSSDVMAELNDEGHHLEPGAVGENITLSGVDWRQLHAGLIVEIGGMKCQLSAPADPCAQIRRWFHDNDSGHIDHSRHPGRARWYAGVVAPGTISMGDSVRVLPPG